VKKFIEIKNVKFYLWVGTGYFILALIINMSQFPGSFLLWVINETWKAAYILVVIYLFFEFTLPQLNRKKIFRSLGLLAAQIFLFSFALYFWLLLGAVLHIYTDFINYSSCSHGVEDQFGASIFAIFIFGISRHIYNYVRLKQAAQQLRIEKQEAELNYLKSQTNPHFLFNTLNNIYSLARDKSDLTPESVLRLSKILRFMLYETSGEYIAIEQELKIISDYIALEKLRYDESLHINFNYDIEENLSFVSVTYYQPKLDDWNDYKIVSENALVIDPGKLVDLYIKFNLRYDSFSPDGIEKTDTATKMGISFKF